MTHAENHSRRRSAASPPVRDPEFDPPNPVRPLSPSQVSVEYQRLVTNPFLAALAVVIAVYLGLRSEDLSKVLAVLGFFGSVLLLQFHCRDCGHTDWFFFWKTHACAAVVARTRAGQARRLRGPNPTTQLVLWLYLLGAIGILVMIVGRTP